jgi:hypothetical protein
MITNDIQLIEELHVIRAHNLHYESLLGDFRKTVLFVLETPNPSTEPLANSDFDAEQQAARKRSTVAMKRECGILLTEIDRLHKSIGMHGMRLKNVMDLVGGVMSAARLLY